MANEMMGYSFQPGQDTEMRRAMNKGPAAGSGGNMANQALRVLSLRLPNVLGGRPLATRSMMTPGMGGNGPTTNNGLGVTGPNSTSGLGALMSGALGGSSPSSGAPNITPGIGPTTPPEIVDSTPGGEYNYGPYNPGGWTGPITGGITGGGGYGSGAPSVGGGEQQMPTMDMNLINGLMRLFGSRG